jgi:hypothetical protein
MPIIRVKRFKVEKKIKPPFTLKWVDAFCRHATPHLAQLSQLRGNAGKYAL